MHKNEQKTHDITIRHANMHAIGVTEGEERKDRICEDVMAPNSRFHEKQSEHQRQPTNSNGINSEIHLDTL